GHPLARPTASRLRPRSRPPLAPILSAGSQIEAPHPVSFCAGPDTDWHNNEFVGDLIWRGPSQPVAAAVVQHQAAGFRRPDAPQPVYRARLLLRWSRRREWHREVVVDDNPVVAALLEDGGPATIERFLRAVLLHHLASPSAVGPGNVSALVCARVRIQREFHRGVVGHEFLIARRILLPIVVLQRRDVVEVALGLL